jgi:hypothetical protein
MEILGIEDFKLLKKITNKATKDEKLAKQERDILKQLRKQEKLNTK